MSLTPADIKRVLEALQESDWDEATITIGDVTIAVARNGATLDTSTAPATSAAEPASEPAVEPPSPTQSAAGSEPAEAESDVTEPVEGEGIVVRAPSVGVFWRSPQPGAPPFVEVGSKVEVGDTLCIVEVMKLMNNVVAEVAGTVTAIHVENAAQVEAGTPLLTIKPAE
jgi:acetyl-CoA carboxylase biotin carboxyl carrier protein